MRCPETMTYVVSKQAVENYQTQFRKRNCPFARVTCTV